MSDTVAAAAPLLAQQGLVELLELVRGIAQEAIRESRERGAPLRKLFTKQQRAFYAEHAPEGIGLDDLVELWLYPDGDRILEISTKCAPSEAFQVAAETRAFLGERGIAPAQNQQTKTRKALSFFSDQLKEASDAV